MEKWSRNKSIFWLFAIPGTFWLVMFFLVPLSIIWALSFGEQVSLTQTRITGTFEHYIRVFGDRVYLKIFWKSIWMSAIATLICLLIAYPVAFLISFVSGRMKIILLAIIILPFWINLLIRTYALIAVFRTRGYINVSLEWLYNSLGLHNIFGAFQPFEMLYNNAAVIMGLVYVFMPFMVLPLYASIEKLNKSFLEASLDLGASQFMTFWKVTLPLTMPGIVSGIILVFIPMLGSFLIPDLLGGTNAQMIGNVIERQFKAANNYPFGAALSFLLLYITFSILALHAWFANRSRGNEY